MLTNAIRMEGLRRSREARKQAWFTKGIKKANGCVVISLVWAKASLGVI
jgi:hypothetical protein